MGKGGREAIFEKVSRHKVSNPPLLTLNKKLKKIQDVSKISLINAKFSRCSPSVHFPYDGYKF